MIPKLCILGNLIVFEKYFLSLLSLCFWTFGKDTLKSLFMIVGLCVCVYMCVYTTGVQNLNPHKVMEVPTALLI